MWEDGQTDSHDKGNICFFCNFANALKNGTGNNHLAKSKTM